MDVANTILRQLGGAGRLTAMIGAHSFVGDTAAPSLTFKFRAKAKNKANCLQVILDPDDTYTARWFKIARGAFDWKKIGEDSGLYAEDLIPYVEDKTGLRLGL